MKRDSEREKVALEHGAAKLFLRCYEKEFGVEMRNIWHNTPSKPDISCYQGDALLDIEIAHLYASETEAMAVLGRPLSISMQCALAKMAQDPNDQKLLAPLQRLLKQKETKRYNSTRTWLLIRNASPLWLKADFEQQLTNIEVPKKHPFEQIWLLCDFYKGDMLRLV